MASSRRALTVLELLGMLAVLFIVVALLFPTAGLGPSNAQRVKAKNDVTQIATAVTAFESEYNRLPGTNSGTVGGEVLAGLVGSNTNINPRQIVFIETQTVKRWKSGVTNGTFVDPWGGAYQIAFDTDNDGSVIAGTNNVVVPKKVAVWNDPRLEKVERGWLFLKKPKSRYVTSWE